MSESNTCASCGEVIPEGIQVCSTCEKKAEEKMEKKRRYRRLMTMLTFMSSLGGEGDGER